jgi:hypothetical protein
MIDETEIENLKEYSETYLFLLKTIKQLHQAHLKKDAVNVYLISCSVVDVAQKLEDICQRDANIQ